MTFLSENKTFFKCKDTKGTYSYEEEKRINIRVRG